MLKMQKILKMQNMSTIFEMHTHEFNHEGLFYHNGRGTKWGGGGGPPRGVSIAKSRHVDDGENILDVFRSSENI